MNDPILIPSKGSIFWGKRAGGFFKATSETKGVSQDGWIFRGRNMGSNFSGNSVPKRRSIHGLLADHARRYGFMNGVKLERRI